MHNIIMTNGIGVVTKCELNIPTPSENLLAHMVFTTP